jgi:hypothetical protein
VAAAENELKPSQDFGFGCFFRLTVGFASPVDSFGMSPAAPSAIIA